MRAVAELPIRKARWRSLVVYGVIFAVGVVSVAGLTRLLRPPPDHFIISFDVQVDYFVSSQPMEGLRATVAEQANGLSDVELVSEGESQFSEKSYHLLRNTFVFFSGDTLIEFRPEFGWRADLHDGLDIRVVPPGQLDLLTVDFSLETPGQNIDHVIQLGEREYRIISVKALPGGPAGENEGKQGYLVISTSRFQRTRY